MDDTPDQRTRRYHRRGLDSFRVLEYALVRKAQTSCVTNFSSHDIVDHDSLGYGSAG